MNIDDLIKPASRCNRNSFSASYHWHKGGREMNPVFVLSLGEDILKKSRYRDGDRVSVDIDLDAQALTLSLGSEGRKLVNETFPKNFKISSSNTFTALSPYFPKKDVPSELKVKSVGISVIELAMPKI